MTKKSQNEYWCVVEFQDNVGCRHEASWDVFAENPEKAAGKAVGYVKEWGQNTVRRVTVCLKDMTATFEPDSPREWTVHRAYDSR